MDAYKKVPRRFASFILAREEAIELAIDAENIMEATTVTGRIKSLPDGVGHLEGLMQLRDDSIPIINLKKRLGLSPTNYPAEAKVAVVRLGDYRFGLLFDDIKDVLLVPAEGIHPIHPGLLNAQSVITDLIKLDQGRRTLEVLDLRRLIGDGWAAREGEAASRLQDAARNRQKTYSRYVVFACRGREYGVCVEQAREITFLADIDDEFQSDFIAGTLKLRGDSIPVLSSARLLQDCAEGNETGSETRVLVLHTDGFPYGLIVDRICEIICIDNDDIMPVPHSGRTNVEGIYQRPNGKNIMLIQVQTLIEDQRQQLQSVARLKSAGDRTAAADRSRCHDSVSAGCYLIFSIGKNFAIALTDVQEIIESGDLMALPAATGHDRRVLNLRGTVVPVLNLRHFLGYDAPDRPVNTKLIIATHQDRLIALEVDHILSLHKQVRSRPSPSLNPQLRARRDALDRLIEWVGETGITEHVLVINVSAIMNNHLGIIATPISTAEEISTKENKHGRSDTSPQLE